MMPALLITVGLLAASAAQAQEPVRWSYDDDNTGQEEWGTLSQDYVTCLMGNQQSPIQISHTTVSKMPFLEIHYGETSADITFDGRLLEIIPSGKHTVVMEGSPYRLKSIQLHTPAEHTLLEDFFPLEIEMLHENAQGKKLMVAVFAALGGHNPALTPVIDNLPTRWKPGKAAFDLAAWLPASRGYYAYTGSLTYPPCTEGVEWRIFKRAIPVSKEQLITLGKLVGRNARLMQPVYMRTVRETKN